MGSIRNWRLLAVACLSFLLAGQVVFGAVSQTDSACAASHIDFSSAVKRIIDGDSLVLQNGKEVRIIAINAPEYDMPFGESAGKYLSRLIGAAKLNLQLGKEERDRYGRLLVHAFDDQGRNLAEQMLREGYGFYVVVAPNDSNAACYVAAEKEAREAKRGLWRSSFYETQDASSSNLETGFVRLRGDVKQVTHYDSGSEVLIGNGRTRLFIPKQHLRKIGGKEKISAAKRIHARGWLTRRNKKKYSMRISHPLMVEYIEVNVN